MIHLIKHPSFNRISLDKLKPDFEYDEEYALIGEEIGLQLVVYSETERSVPAKIKVEGSAAKSIYIVRDVSVGWPHYSMDQKKYSVDKSNAVPDCLVPIDQADTFYISKDYMILWISLTPKFAGEHCIKIAIETEKESATTDFTLRCLNQKIQRRYFSSTNYIDPHSISRDHRVPLFCDVYWRLLRDYFDLAVENGINNIMVPIFTPIYENYPREEPIQLVRVIVKGSNEYQFNFDLMDSWIAIARQAGIENFTFPAFLPDLSTCKGPRIVAEKDGREVVLFENETVESTYYLAFIRKFLRALSRAIDRHKVKGGINFHFSCSALPMNLETFVNYREHFYDCIPKYGVYDYDVQYCFYKQGRVGMPIIYFHDLYGYADDELALKTACFDVGDDRDLINPLIATNPLRLRLLGAYSYRYEIIGLFHMGFNYSAPIFNHSGANMMCDTDYNHRYPSGSLSLVYPGEKLPYPSIRLKQMKYAIQDYMAIDVLHERYSPTRMNGLVDKILKLGLERFEEDGTKFMKFRHEIYQLIENVIKYRKR